MENDMGVGVGARIGDKNNAYRVVLGRPEGKRQHGRPRRRREKILEWVFKNRS
jgi:hypothetical protein